MTKTCEWVSTCEEPAVGVAGPHPIHGVLAQICATCADCFRVPLIQTYGSEATA